MGGKNLLSGSVALPPETHQSETIQRYQKICEEAYATLNAGKQVQLDPADMQVHNGSEAELNPSSIAKHGFNNGAIFLEAKVPQNDFYCQGFVMDSGETEVIAGSLEHSQARMPMTIFRTQDTAELIKTVVGEDELMFSNLLEPGEWRSPALKDTDSEIFKTFKQMCTAVFKRESLSRGFQEFDEFDWRQVQLSEEFGIVVLRAESRVLNHVCVAVIDLKEGVLVFQEGVAEDNTYFTSDDVFAGLSDGPIDPTKSQVVPQLEMWKPEELCVEVKKLGLEALAQECTPPDHVGTMVSGTLSSFGAVGGTLASYLIYKAGHRLLSYLTPYAQSLGANRTAAVLSRGRMPLFFNLRPNATAEVLGKRGKLITKSPLAGRAAARFQPGKLFEMFGLAYLGSSVYQVIEDLVSPKSYDSEHKGVVKENKFLGLTGGDWMVAGGLTTITAAEYAVLKYGSQAALSSRLLGQLRGFKSLGAGMTRLWVADQIFAAFRDDYEQSLDNRAKNEFFKKEVYTLDNVHADLSGFSAAGSLAEKGIRVTFNSLVPNMWDAATSENNPEIYNEIRAEDRDVARKHTEAMRERLAIYLAFSGQNSGDLKVERLNQWPDLGTVEEMVGSMILQGKGAEIPQVWLQQIDRDDTHRVLASSALQEFRKLTSLAASSIIPELEWASNIFDEDNGEVELDQEDIQKLFMALYGSEANAQKYIEAEKVRWGLAHSA